MTSRALCATFVATLAIACGGDDGDAADAAPRTDAASERDAAANPDAMPVLTGIDALCDARQGAYVALAEKAVVCMGKKLIFELHDPRFFEPGRVESMCRSHYQPFVEDGTIELDEAAFAACRTYIEQTPCELLAFFPELQIGHTSACSALFVGTLEPAARCDISEQCAGDTYCAPTADDCGACSSRRGDGAGCTAADECSSGACREDGTCGAPRPPGGACNGDRDCAGVLQCIENVCTVVRPQEGDGCTSHADCAFVPPPDAGLYCDIAGDGTCKPLPGPGEACVDFDPDPPFEKLCDIFAYAWCDPVDDTCKEPSISQAGEPCSAIPTIGSGARRCADGLVCSAPIDQTDGKPDGVCYDPRTIGETCSPDYGAPDQCQLMVLECAGGICQSSVDEYSGMCPAP